MDDEDEKPFPRQVEFRLRRSVVSATANLVSRQSRRTNVLRLAIRRSYTSVLLTLIFSWFPQWFRLLVQSFWPGPFLPDYVILKTPKPEPGWDDEWDNEKLMYDRLKAVQGTYIPILNGEAEYNGKPALVLSYVGGPTLLEVKHLEVVELEEKLHDSFAPLQIHGVLQDDPSPSNFILVNRERIVTVDLERVSEPVTPDKISFATECTIQRILDQYEQRKSACRLNPR